MPFDPEDFEDSFGPIVSFHVAEQAILDLTERWFREYLAAAEKKNGFDPHTFPDLADWDVVKDFEKWPDERLPFLLVMYMGLSERPMRFGDGSYMIRAIFGASIVVSTNTKRDTRIAAGVYAAAFQAMMMQNRDLERPDLIAGFNWIDSRPSPMPAESARSLAAHQMLFQLDLKNVVSEGGRPPEDDPREDPYDPIDPPPTIEFPGRVRIDIVKEIEGE
jgi:hypothetical protein